MRFFQDGKLGAGEDANEVDVNARAEWALNNSGNAVLRLAYAYVRNTSDEEEILQDAVLRILRAGPPLESEEHVKAWLLRVTANLSKNRLRHNSARCADELIDELVAEERGDLSFVWEAVQSLPEKYRAAIHVYDYEGNSVAEVAKILSMKESTARSNLARGR